jgi:hypothetical protein
MPMTGAQTTNVAALAQGVARYINRTMGDYWDPAWADLETWEQDEWKALVGQVDDSLVANASELHAFWRARRSGTGDAGVDDAGEGWANGGAKDLDLKTDPDLLSYRRLNLRRQQYWTIVYDAIVQGIACVNA